MTVGDDLVFVASCLLSVIWYDVQLRFPLERFGKFSGPEAI